MKNIVGSPVEKSYTLSVVPIGGSVPSKYSSKVVVPIPASKDIQIDEDTSSDWKNDSKGSLSFRKAKKSGAIVMNPYSVGLVTTSFSLARVPFSNFFYDVIDTYSVRCSPYKLAYDSVTLDLRADWHEQGYYSYWSKRDNVKLFQAEVDVSSEIERVKTDLLSKLNTTYDLLTEIAEWKSTVELISSIVSAARHPLKTFKSKKDDLYKAFRRGELKTYSHLLKEVSQAWLVCRYGIMPLVYSIQDILKTLKLKNTIYRTVRSGNDVDAKVFSNPAPILPYSLHIRDTVSGTIKIRAVGKDRYTEGMEVQLSDLIGFNPFVTAWEKVPYSFVVDWFINIGDYLDSVTSSYTSMASERKCCYSVKLDYRVDTDLYWSINNSKVFKKAATTVCGGVIITPSFDVRRGGFYEGSARLRSTKYLSYERVIFDASDVKLSFSAELSLKRTLDAIALSVLGFRSKFRALR